MGTFFKFVHKVEFTENPRHLPVFLWMVISLSVIANAQSNERASEYELSLTCIFGENIEDRRLGFRILDDQSAVGLKCSWRQEKLYCVLGHGFSYEWTRSDKVEVRKNVYSDEASFCSCFLTDHDQTACERPCNTEVRPVSELIERLPQNNEPSVDKPSQNCHSEAQSNERASEYELSLTCIFGENIEDRRLGFRILDDQSAVGLKCSWRREKLHCVLGHGFSYEWTRSDKVEVRKNVYSYETSFCSCFLTDHDQTAYERPCNTEVRPVSELIERLPQNNESSVVKLSQNCHSEAASSNSQRSESSDHVLIPVAAALGLLLMLAIVVAIYFFVLFRWGVNVVKFLLSLIV